MTEETNKVVAPSEVDEPKIKKSGVMGRFARIAFRILVAVVIGLALGVGLYFGVLRFYREVVEPIQSYEARIGDLERSLEAMHQELETDSAATAMRQAEIEGRLAEQGEAIASAEALVGAAQADLREQRKILGTVEDLSNTLDELSLALGSLSLRVEQLDEAIAAGDLPAQRVQRTAVYLRSMTLLTRARLELDRDNLGFAREQLEAAHAILTELATADASSAVEPPELPLLSTILERLDLVMMDVQSRPAVAEDELEAIWRLFLEATNPVQLEDVEAGGE
jgi:chromosome segregation ATPase